VNPTLRGALHGLIAASLVISVKVRRVALPTMAYAGSARRAGELD